MSAACRLACALALAVIFNGCGPRAVEHSVELDPPEVQLRHIGNAYGQAIQKLKRGPRDLEELKPFLGTDATGEATAKAIAGQQIIVIWGLGAGDVALQSAPGAPPRAPVVAYATTKDEGKRFVLTTLSRIELMTDEEFQNAYFPKGHKPKR